MSELLREVLRDRADAVAVPAISVDELAARGDQIRRRRRLTGVGVAAAAVALVAGIALLTDQDTSSEPVRPPQPERSNTRPLTYAEGTSVHYGDKTLEAPAPVVELDLTDNGVAVLTDDGRVWFTDGGELEQIGSTGAYADTPEWRDAAFTRWVVSGNWGYSVAWLEYPEESGPADVWVYDSYAREVVAKGTLPVDRERSAMLYSAYTHRAYVVLDPEEFETSFDLEPQLRLDVTTGVQHRLAPGDYQAELASQGKARTLVVGESGAPDTHSIVEGIGSNWQVQGDRLVPMGVQPLYARDASSGQRVVFRMPPGYPNTRTPLVWLFAWLDDDTMAMVASERAERAGYDGRGEDLLVCRVSTKQCELALDGGDLAGSIVVPGLPTTAAAEAAGLTD